MMIWMSWIVILNNDEIIYCVIEEGVTNDKKRN